VRLIAGAKLVLVEKVNSCVEFSKTYSRVRCMNFSAVLVWPKMINLSSLSVKKSFNFNSDLGQCAVKKASDKEGDSHHVIIGIT
jgi:hypothetical protein